MSTKKGIEYYQKLLPSKSVTKTNNTEKKDISYYQNLLSKEKTQEPSAVDKSEKPTNPSDLLKRVTVTDYPTINKLATQQEQQRKEAERQEQERWNNLSVGEKIVDPFKTMGANITYGDLGIKENVAWNEYRSKQDDASLQAAQAATKAREEFEATNDRIGKGNAVTKDFAQYLPQLGGQLKAGAVGAAGGAGAGAAGGAGIALAAGQLGPQVAVPEEIATVPAGALTGAIWGGRGGYVAGTAKYSYDMMAGSAYKTLLDMGVPNDVALELSGDEALVNSLIEGGGAIVDLISLGFGKLVGKGGTTAAKEVAKNRLLAAAKAYGLNLVSEPLEEMAQEKVSIETEKRAADKTGIERNVTSAEDWERIKGAGETALKVAAVSGALNAGGNYITNNIGGKIASNAKSNVPNASQMQDTQQPNATLPIQAEMAQKANMEQIARNRKNTLENKINSNKYLSQQEKNDLIAMLNTTNVTTEVETEIDNILNTVNNEFGLKNITSDFEANKSNYTKYLNDKTEIDNSYIDSAKNAISTKDGKRTKEQWLSVAKNLGNQIYEMSDGDVEKYAYRTWIENRPNNAQNLNRQGKKYVKFGLDEWVNAVYDSVRDARNRTTETTGNLLPTQRAETTLQSAKIAGANDINMNKAIELNDLLRSGAEVKFYNPQNIPQGVDANKAKVANGFYSNGTVWINKNTKNAVEVVLGHELTHHLETTDSYTDLANTILDSDVFYDYIAEKGYSNVAEYKQSLGQNYTTEQFDSEMVANFVQDKLFSDQNSIDRLARQNATLVEKIKNWISDLVVSFKGTAQEKELRRIEGMYRKALEQARNSTATSTDTQYSVGGVIGARNIQKNPRYRDIMDNYEQANRLMEAGANNRETIRRTGWFKDTDGNVKYEFTDEDMALKDSYKFDDNKVYPLEKILKHDILFEAYPQLRDYTVLSMDIGDTHRAAIFSPLKVILLNNQKLKTREQVEYSLIHEIQHAIQNIEGFPGARTNINGKYAYYTSLGEIESRNTSDRLRMLAEERRQYIPETAKENPTHPSLEKYLKTRKQADIEKDNKYIAKKERTEALKESVKKFMEGRIGFDDFEENNNSNIYKTTSEDDKLSSRIDGGRRLADAGKEPAFSMPETDDPDIRYSMNPVDVAKNETRALSRYAQTLQSKHEDIPEQINLIQKEVDNGNFTHEVVHDKRSLNYAQKYIEENGFEDAVKHWDELIKRGKPVDKDELALGQMIYNVAVDNKDTRLVMKMASDLVQEYTEVGRNLQSATLLRKMTPDGRLYALERSVQKLNQDLMQKFDDFENIKIPEELADELLRSETQKDMDIAVEKIQTYIASKIPATWQEKLNSWRYLSMLGNPRTHIRNIIGNAVFIPAVEVKNALAQVGELAISKDQRTKAFLGKKDAKLLNYAENDFDKNHEIIRGENKYDIRSGIQEKRTIYSNKALEAARKGNFSLLEAEDTLFLKYRYKKAFAGALKARGITIEQLRENSPETVRKVNEIRSYAINEAQKATYRDASIVASMISRAKRRLLNTANQSTGAAKLGYNLAYLGAEGVIPFTKTPVNIVKRGIEYSPAGLLNGVKNALFDVKSGKVTAAQAIDKIAAGATGTAIVALGSWLASMGLVNGGEEEKEKEQALKQLKGYQDYSLNIGDKSYTIDWMAPSSIPLFIGVELYNSINSNDESAYLNALSNMVEPVVEMSMLQGLNDTLTTLGEDSALGNIIAKTLTNYLGQYNPTLLGQIARTFDPVRRTTYVDKNIPVPALVQKFIQQQAAKIPGISRMLPTYKDQFGQEQLTDGVINRIVQNFTSPGYLKDIKEGAVEKGLTELYEKTGEISVIPSYASKTLTQNGEKINLTAKQYDTYAKTRGNVSKRGLEGLFNDSNYKNLTDEQKVKVVEGIYDYANKMAKSEVLENFELEDNEKKIQKLEKGGLEFYKYIMLKKTADADGNDYTSNEELDNAIKKYGLSNWKNTIKEKNTKGKNDLPTQAQQKAKLKPLKN